MSSEKQELKNNGKGISGLVFVGCLMIGLAVGFLMGNFVVGILGGLGVGFIGMAIAMATSKQDSMRKGISGLVFVGCLMLGMAVGFLVGNIVVGLFGGLGIGFITMYIAYNSTGEW
jgi:hypothetical protein